MDGVGGKWGTAAVGGRFTYVVAGLKKNQPEKWKELGSPSFFDNGSWANQRALRKFLNTLDSSTGSDQEVISRGRAVALINKIYVPTCALVLIAMFYFLVRH